MTDTTTAVETDAAADARAADAALKARHRTMWGLGDYPDVAARLIAELGPVLVAATGIRPGDRVLDVAAGTGNVAVPAALAGADVIASDLTPELFPAGRAAAERQGVTLQWQEGDAEALPYPDDAFDVVTSCVGVMFAPHHQQAADELVRVCRPGGRIGLISWTPEGFVGDLFKTMKPFAPPPPPGAQPPPLWGDEAHVRALLGDRVTDVETERRTVTIAAFDTPDGFRSYWKETYGPTIVAYRNNAEDAARTAELDREIAAVAERHARDGQGLVMDWEYLLLTARVV
ncbi:class I SAM-dependent methyltransferase [Actinomycetospora lemnae]|uniref:Methyltransferase domain-containing protein n=1 Tax=Actinomycetospora lemnae TaxID=3019891 RepID=A0ABT5T2B8_9PSEU|nr:methyltransferase domain-containing protein [Actinomycetospora sp. DW7H6]MDD7969154.1 methyltransferase domain-containing protein [Actinomycetospora sp. DW7H6]